MIPPFIASALKNSRTSSVSKLPIFAGREVDVPDEERPPRKVERRPDQRVVHREVARPIAPDAALVAERLRQRPPERDADVLDGVMVVDLEVALGADVQVDHRMPRQLVEHMVEEADAGLAVVLAAAVEVDPHRQRRLGGRPADLGPSHRILPGLTRGL